MVLALQLIAQVCMGQFAKEMTIFAYIHRIIKKYK